MEVKKEKTIRSIINKLSESHYTIQIADKNVNESISSFVLGYPFDEEDPNIMLASGLLAGKYNKDTTFNDLRKDMPHFQGDKFKKNLERVEQLSKIANEKNAEIAHVVLAWYLTHDSIDVVIPGAKRVGQVLDNLKTLDVHCGEHLHADPKLLGSPYQFGKILSGAKIGCSPICPEDLWPAQRSTE